MLVHIGDQMASPLDREDKSKVANLSLIKHIVIRRDDCSTDVAKWSTRLPLNQIPDSNFVRVYDCWYAIVTTTLLFLFHDLRI